MTKRSRYPLPAEAMFGIAVQALAGLLEQREGAVFGWTPIDEYSGEVGLEVATVCRGTERLTVGRSKVDAWKYELIKVGRTASTAWFVDNILVKLEANGSVVATTEEDATKCFA